MTRRGALVERHDRLLTSWARALSSATTVRNAELLIGHASPDAAQRRQVVFGVHRQLPRRSIDAVGDVREPETFRAAPDERRHVLALERIAGFPPCCVKRRSADNTSVS